MKRGRLGAEILILLAERAEYRRDRGRYLVLGSSHHSCRGRRGGRGRLAQRRANTGQISSRRFNLFRGHTQKRHIQISRLTTALLPDGNQGTLLIVKWKRTSSRVKTSIFKLNLTQINRAEARSGADLQYRV